MESRDTIRPVVTGVGLLTGVLGFAEGVVNVGLEVRFGIVGGVTVVAVVDEEDVVDGWGGFGADVDIVTVGPDDVAAEVGDEGSTEPPQPPSSPTARAIRARDERLMYSA